MYIFAIYDKKIGQYADIFPVEHKAQATRSFTTLVNREGSNLNDYPEDFDLYYCCEVDMKTGSMLINDKNQPEFVISGVSCKRSE